MDGMLYEAVKGAYRVIWDGLFAGDTVGLQHIPQTGPFLLACNHASYFDPPFLGGAVTSRNDVYFFARKTLFKPGLAEKLMSNLNCIPIDRDGESDIGAFKRVLQVLKNGQGVGIFVEGTRTRDGNLQPARRGVGLMACKSRAPIVPARIFGTFEAWPRGGLNFQFGTSVHLVFGEPIQVSTIDPGPEDGDRYQKVADAIMAAIAQLQPPCALEL